MYFYARFYFYFELSEFGTITVKERKVSECINHHDE